MHNWRYSVLFFCFCGGESSIRYFISGSVAFGYPSCYSGPDSLKPLPYFDSKSALVSNSYDLPSILFFISSFVSLFRAILVLVTCPLVGLLCSHYLLGHCANCTISISLSWVSSSSSFFVLSLAKKNGPLHSTSRCYPRCLHALKVARVAVMPRQALPPILSCLLPLFFVLVLVVSPLFYHQLCCI